MKPPSGQQDSSGQCWDGLWEQNIVYDLRHHDILRHDSVFANQELWIFGGRNAGSYKKTAEYIRQMEKCVFFHIFH